MEYSKPKGPVPVAAARARVDVAVGRGRAWEFDVATLLINATNGRQAGTHEVAKRILLKDTVLKCRLCIYQPRLKAGVETR